MELHGPRYKPFQGIYYGRGKNPRPSMPGRFFSLGDALAGDELFDVDSELERYRRAKATVGAEQRGASWLSDRERRAVLSRLLSAQTSCATRAPLENASPQPRDPLWAELEKVTDLNELVSLVQEDVVVMRKGAREEASEARAAYVNVSLPSGWCPACLLGQTFIEFHAPVPPDGAFTPDKHDGFAHHLWPGAHPKVRFVWTVTPGNELSRQRCHRGAHHTAALTTWQGATRAFLRVERQVIVEVDPCLSAFLIRVYVHDVKTLDPRDRVELLHAVEALATNESVARYKGFYGNLDEIRRCFVEGASRA